jgi:hypothetical protein
MHKDAALIAQHRRPALVVALFTLVVATIIGCDGKGVDVAVVGIPADTTVTVSVDSLSQDIAAAPSKVYRYRGIGYARLLGLVAAPSYTATARRLDGCAVAVGSVEYAGEDEVRINLHPTDGCDKTPTPVEPQPIAPQPQPQPMPQPQPPADADRDGVPDAQDLCPLLAGSQANTARPGCPLPRTVAAQLVPMAKGGMQTATGYDFTVSTAPQYLDYLIILPVEATTARQVSVDYSIAASAKWAAPSGWCASQGLPNRHQLGSNVPGTTTYCLVYGYRAGLSSLSLQPGEFIAESPRPAGDAPTTIKATMPQGQVGIVDAKAQNVVRLMLAGTVSVNDVVATATVTMEW